jgi:hypothetical protein
MCAWIGRGRTVISMSNFRVVVCGGGIAAVEGLLRLRRLLGSSVDIDVVAPNDELVMRPLAVRQPFAFGPPSRYELRHICADNEANWLKDTLVWVDREAQVVHTGGGESLRYDALLIAVGGRQIEAFEHVTTFRDAEADETYQGVVQDIEEGYSKGVAFLLPDGPVWPLPLYELALMTAERAYSMGIDELELSIVTPEVRPMAIFGSAAGDAVAGLLERAGITVYLSAVAQIPAAGHVTVQPQGVELHPGRMIATPRMAGSGIRGLVGGAAHGFIPHRLGLPRARPGRARSRGRRRRRLSNQARGTRSPDGRHRSSVDRAASRSRCRGQAIPAGDPGQAADRRSAALHQRTAHRPPRLRVRGLRHTAVA